ncbi:MULTISPECIES: DUF6036 family nucleotidyltransferase [unclassified Aeromicrobium]|uniref:DUF6036 family nucleotidyltransferase n=1 Tax=unclassified Aeromicrobium TaxID=2633570 RepID=UPI00396B3A6A
MRRDQLEHAIRTACQIIGSSEIIIVGSQAILGTFNEDELPAAATMSVEVDALPIAETNEEIAELADQIEGVAGEWSPFEEQHGFSIDGVDLTTAVLPQGWRERLVKVQNANTAAPGGQPQFTGWCPDKEDLCVSKLCAYREKDLNFVAALLDARLVAADVIIDRLRMVPEEHAPEAGRATNWVAALPNDDADRYDYRLEWSADDAAFVATCAEFPSLSWAATSPESALLGLKRLVREVIEDLRRAGEPVPMPRR